MKDLSEIFFNVYRVYSFFIIFGGLAFLGTIINRVYTELLPQYQTVQKCAVPTKSIFRRVEQVKVKCFGGGGGGPQPPYMVPIIVKYTRKVRLDNM